MNVLVLAVGAYVAYKLYSASSAQQDLSAKDGYHPADSGSPAPPAQDPHGTSVDTSASGQPISTGRSTGGSAPPPDPTMPPPSGPPPKPPPQTGPHGKRKHLHKHATFHGD